jgi:hypothetical protein
MRARWVHQAGTGQRGGAAGRWRGAVRVTACPGMTSGIAMRTSRCHLEQGIRTNLTPDTWSSDPDAGE